MFNNNRRDLQHMITRVLFNSREDPVKLIYSSAHLTELPVDIGTDTSVQVLHVDHNELTSLSEGVANLKNLTELDLSCNEFNVFPSEIRHLNT